MKHGTSTGYEYHGCRCTPCREAHTARIAGLRARQLAYGWLTHGNRASYDAGCRCTPCKEARRAARLRLRSEGAA